jgi:hypothetical protein
MKTFILLAIMCLAGNTSQVPNNPRAQTNNASDSKGTPPLRVVNNCGPTYEAEQEQHYSPRGSTSVWANVPNWLLVGVGIITFLAVWKQAVETKKAAKAAQESVAAVEKQTPLLQASADAARMSAEALVNSERAWVMTKVCRKKECRPEIGEYTDHQGELCTTISGFEWISRNDGRTPAWIIEQKLWCRIAQKLPDIPDISSPACIRIGGPNPLGVGESNELPIDWAWCKGKRGHPGDPPSAWGDRPLFIYGVVKYRDIFGQYETWFGYILRGEPQNLRFDRLGIFDSWRDLAEYNKNT